MIIQMIIHDTEHCKIDLSWQMVPGHEDYLQITSFNLRGTEWRSKIIRLSAKTVCKMIQFIGEHHGNEDGSE